MSRPHDSSRMKAAKVFTDLHMSGERILSVKERQMLRLTFVFEVAGKTASSGRVVFVWEDFLDCIKRPVEAPRRLLEQLTDIVSENIRYGPFDEFRATAEDGIKRREQ